MCLAALVRCNQRESLVLPLLLLVPGGEVAAAAGEAEGGEVAAVGAGAAAGEGEPCAGG